MKQILNSIIRCFYTLISSAWSPGGVSTIGAETICCGGACFGGAAAENKPLVFLGVDVICLDDDEDADEDDEVDDGDFCLWLPSGPIWGGLLVAAIIRCRSLLDDADEEADEIGGDGSVEEEDDEDEGLMIRLGPPPPPPLCCIMWWWCIGCCCICCCCCWACEMWSPAPARSLIESLLPLPELSCRVMVTSLLLLLLPPLLLSTTTPPPQLCCLGASISISTASLGLSLFFYLFILLLFYSSCCCCFFYDSLILSLISGSYKSGFQIFIVISKHNRYYNIG